MNSLQKLREYGQSYWLDNLTRGKILTGEIKDRIDNQGLGGITSNPAIFNKAISSGKDYNEQISELARQGADSVEAYEKIVIQDIKNACDAMKEVYDKTGGADGFVSLEVSPHLARDTEGTLSEVKRFFKLVDRPNCLIKIPGTVEGLPAIEEALYEGININITLLFSVKVYEEVARTYIRALKRRKDAGLPIDNIASVASFFLSRIDVLVDKKIQTEFAGNPKAESLLGTIAKASAKMAYQSFLKIFSGPEWEALSRAGARVQRPLWASTSTKNPDYSDVMYVEPLIGEHTVNTMPDVTIDAFLDHGTAAPDTILEGLDESKEYLRQLEEVGIDLDAVTDQLVDEGIQKFNDPFDALQKLIAQELESAKQKL